MNVRSVGLVARREIREQLRGKALWVSTVIFVVAIVALIVGPAEIRSGRPTYHVALASPPTGAAAAASAAITATAAPAGARVVVTTVDSEAAALAALLTAGHGKADIAVLDGTTPRVVVDRPILAGSTSTLGLLTAEISRAVSVARAIDASGLPPAQARALASPVPLPIGHLRPAKANTSQRLAALASAVLFFVLVQRYGFGLLAGVIQEKSGRVVELLLTALRPVELLAGKVAGSGLVVLAQAGVFVVAALVSAAAVGSSILHGSGALTLLVSFAWIVVGFFFYATLFAAGGSLASKPEDAQSVALPLQLPLFVGYFVAFSALGSGTANPLLKVLAYLPPTAPLDMPVLAATGGAGPLDVAVSMALCVAGTVVVARVAATVFARSILHTGTRLKAREVLRAAPSAAHGRRAAVLGEGA